jgi:two-component system cell cycle response regulator
VTKATILVVEDSMVVRAVVCEQLEDEGYDVLEADDGNAALDRCRTARPDAILLDIEMPGLNGLQVLEQLKQDPDLCDTPVVFLTGRTTTDDMVAGLHAGAHDYLRKPFEEAELIARIGAAVRVKQLQDQLRLRNLELDQISRLDGLTGLYNRRHLHEELQRRHRSLRRDDGLLALLILDVDHFKQINDTEGHSGGDAVLCELARRFHDAVRPDDIIGRWGGEEFLAILPRTDLVGARAVGERIRTAVERTPVLYGDREIVVSVSGGCAAGDGDDPEDLVRQADAALYAAKAAGRNRIG